MFSIVYVSQRCVKKFDKNSFILGTKLSLCCIPAGNHMSKVNNRNTRTRTIEQH